MKNLTEYAIFVMQAHLVGCEIEYKDKHNRIYCISPEPTWNWGICDYRIKLPEGWEYVIEDGEIAFREPKEGEWFLLYCDGTPIQAHKDLDCRRPIIKRIEEKSE